MSPDQCPDEIILRSFLDGVLIEEESSQVDSHIQVCGTCDKRLAQMAGYGKPIDVAFIRSVNQNDSGSSLVPEDDLAPAIPGLEIGGVIGRGGMGVVYQVYDTRLNRDLAMKIMGLKQSKRDSSRSRFLEEAKVTAQLQHPGVPPVHEVGETADGRPYLLMKMIKGETLERRIASATSFVERARLLGEYDQICQTVAYAHDRGVIHRDLKASNVMIGAFGAVQVIDWGLAKVISKTEVQTTVPSQNTVQTIVTSGRDSDMTNDGSILGTFSVMPPEQARGQIDLIGKSSDVFALGGILCHIVTGEPTYTGDDIKQVRRKAENCEVEEALTRLQKCGAEPEWIVLARQCLAQKHADRPASATEVAQTVAKLLNDADQRRRQAEIALVKTEVERQSANEVARAERHRRHSQLMAIGLIILIASLSTYYYVERTIANGRKTASIDAALDQVEVELKSKTPNLKQIAATLALTQPDIASTEGKEQGERHVAYSKCADFLKCISEIDFERWQQGINAPSVIRQHIRERYPIAFEQCSIDLHSDPANTIATKLRRSPISSELIAALYRYVEPCDIQPKIYDVLDIVDPIPMHVEIRNAYRSRDPFTIDTVLKKLGDSVLTAAICEFIGQSPHTDGHQAVAFLDKSLIRYPYNFGLAMSAAERVSQLIDNKVHDSTQLQHGLFLDKYHTRQAVTYYRIAMALQPKITTPPVVASGTNRRYKHQFEVSFHEDQQDDPVFYCNIGHAYRIAGDWEPATDAYEEAQRLDPTWDLPHFGLGRIWMDRKDFGKAVISFREALRLEDNDSNTLNALGDSLRLNGNLEEALEVYTQAVQIAPHFASPHNGLGLIYYAQGDAESSIREHQKAVSLNDKESVFHDNLGHAYRLGMQLDLATKSHQEAMRLDPKWAPPHHGIGLVWLERKAYEEAIEALQIAIQIDGRDSIFHDSLGDAYRLKDESELARLAYEEAVHLDSSMAGPHKGLGLIWYEKDEYDKAIEEYETAIRLDKNDPFAHSLLGEACRMAGDIEKARTAFGESIRLDARMPQSYNGMGNLYFDNKQYDNAIQEYSIAIQLRPSEPLFQDNLGDAYRMKGDVDLAEAAYKKAIQLDSNLASPHNGLGLLYLSSNLYHRAIEEFQAAVQRDNGMVRYHDHLGDAYRMKGESRLAENAYRNSIGLDPKSATPHNGVGMVYMSEGNHSAAVQEFQQAIALAPSDTVYLSNCAYALHTNRLYDLASREYQKAIDINNDDPVLHSGKACALLHNDQLDAALLEYRNAIQLTRMGAGKVTPSEILVQAARDLIVCKRPYSALTFVQAECDVQSDRTEHPGLRFGVACAHCLVAAEQGLDIPKDEDGGTHRKVALKLLRLELNDLRIAHEHEKLSDSVSGDVETLLSDRSLSSVRDNVSTLPLDEQAQWTVFWEDVRLFQAATMLK